eukprot:Gb_06308 [translate_table: standard]
MEEGGTGGGREEVVDGERGRPLGEGHRQGGSKTEEGNTRQGVGVERRDARHPGKKCPLPQTTENADTMGERDTDGWRGEAAGGRGGDRRGRVSAVEGSGAAGRTGSASGRRGRRQVRGCRQQRGERGGGEQRQAGPWERRIIIVMNTWICVIFFFPLIISLPAGESDLTSVVFSDCAGDMNSNAFDRNLKNLLQQLVKEVPSTGYAALDSQGNDSTNKVYALGQCRGDLDAFDCRNCASVAQTTLLQSCSRDTSGLVQLEGCSIQYDDYSFFSEMQSDCNDKNSTDPNFNITLRSLLENVASRAQANWYSSQSVVFPSRKHMQLYAFAQCSRLLSWKDCGDCLTECLKALGEDCRPNALGAQTFSDKCTVRYEVYNFLSTHAGASLRPRTAQSPRSGSPGHEGAAQGKKRSRLPIIFGVLAAALIVLALLATSVWEKDCPNLATISDANFIFEYEVLRNSTGGFRSENILGKGGCGSVFKGILPDGREVAVKKLFPGLTQGRNAFVNEVNLIRGVQHKNLAKLLGCSIQDAETLLVYEYLSNGSLDRILFNDKKRSRLLEWKTRFEIIVGTARGLSYLHEESQIRIVHRDIKPSNILLDGNFKPKIADFGLARLLGEDRSHISTRLAGTFGYMAPEYAMNGQLSDKADVFSFGVLVLEIVSGRKNVQDDAHSLVEKTWKLYNSGDILDIIDQQLEGNIRKDMIVSVVHVGLLCTQASARLRPRMSQVVQMLTSGLKLETIEMPSQPAFVGMEMKVNHNSTVTDVGPR